MTVNIIEDAIRAKDTQKLLNLLSLITQGLQRIAKVEIQDTPKSGDVEPDLKKRVTALDHMKRHGENGKLQFLNSILIPGSQNLC